MRKAARMKTLQAKLKILEDEIAASGDRRGDNLGSYSASFFVTSPHLSSNRSIRRTVFSQPLDSHGVAFRPADSARRNTDHCDRLEHQGANQGRRSLPPAFLVFSEFLVFRSS